MKVRVAPTLGGGFERTFEEAWNLETYKGTDDPTVFVGIYGLPDFYSLWRHKGKRYIFWCGSDIRHLHAGYWLDDKGDIKLPSKSIAKWINENCENWVENTKEQELLAYWGIKSKVCPSFLGDVNKFSPSFHSNGKYYTSVSGNNFNLYGWDKLVKFAKKHPELEFHLYGNTEPFNCDLSNVIVKGRVPLEKMNKEISEMEGAIRMVEFEGFSEIIAKSLLMAQWPISLIKYPYTISPDNYIRHKSPNLKGREHYIKELNNYPWVK